MIEEKERILLGIDFIGRNFPSALYSLQRWAEYAKNSSCFVPVIGVSTFCRRSAPLPAATNLIAEQALRVVKDCCSGLEVLHWDTDVNELAAAILSENGIKSCPSWSDFSYGGAVNRLLLLANEASCPCLVRVDPGTVPPTEKPFDDILHHHLSWIGDSSIVVSRGYKGRLALREIFLIEGKADDQCDLVHRMTGIDPLAQVTGGGMFTSKVPGIPALPFAGTENGPTLVWGSDDGIYQILPSTLGSRKVGAIEVPRFDVVGKPKSTKEYYRGVAGTVFLASVLRDIQNATHEVQRFLDRIAGMLDDRKCREIDGNENWRSEFTRANVAPDGFLDKIKEGCRNHVQLCEEWSRIADLLRGKLITAVQVAG